MVHARVLEEYIRFTLMYMTDRIFTVLPIKHLVKQLVKELIHRKLNLVQNDQYQI